jgi:hypothetical protein
MLALKPKTGELVWHYQFTPNDPFDYDGVNDPVLTTLKIDGKDRKVLMQANRNGFFYVLDRTNGEFLRGNQFVDYQNWADGLDPAALARLDGATPPDADPAAYRAALVRLKQARGLYQESTSLRLRPGGLFKAEVQLPANAATGPYEARIYLFRNGRVAQMERAEILITRAGLERRIFDFANQRPLLYGFCTVAIALLAGWAAALAFRRS